MAIVQQEFWNTQNETNGTLIVTGPANPTGSTIIVPVGIRTRDTSLELSVTDNAGNTYYKIPNVTGRYEYSWLFYAPNAAPATSLTVTTNITGVQMNACAIIYTGIDPANPIDTLNHVIHPDGLTFPAATVTPSGPSLVIGMFAAGVTNRTIVQQNPDYIQMLDHKRGQLNTQLCALPYPVGGQPTGPNWDIESGNSSSASVITVAFRADSSVSPEDPIDPSPDDPDDIGLDMTAASGWSTVAGGTRLDVISSDQDSGYISTAVNPQQEDLTLTLPAIAPPTDDLEMPLRLSVTAGQAELLAELYNPATSSWLAATKLVVSGDQPSFYTATWPEASLSSFSASSWQNGLNVRLRATAGARPLFNQVTSSGLKPIYLGIVNSDGVDVGITSGSVALRLYRATVLASPYSGGGSPDPDPDPDPEPEPPAPATILHGSEIPATSALAEQFIGAQGPLTEWSGDTNLTGTQVIENTSFSSKNIRIRDGANITLRNCLIVGAPGSSSYTVRINEGSSRLLMENCTIVSRSVANGGTGQHAVAGWGNTSLAMRRCVIRGGIDGVHYHGNGPAVWSTGDSLVPAATFLMEECWIGDNERYGESHSDLFQMAGARPNLITNFLFRRNRFMGYSLERGADSLTNRADPNTSGFASAGFMNSTGGSTQGPGASYVAVRDNFWEGGNYVFDGGLVWDGTCSITGNLFAPKANYGATVRVGNWDNRNNRWSASGTLNNGTAVVGGELISGSSA